MGVVNDLVHLVNDLVRSVNALAGLINALVPLLNALAVVGNDLMPTRNALVHPVNVCLPAQSHFRLGNRLFSLPKRMVGGRATRFDPQTVGDG